MWTSPMGCKMRETGKGLHVTVQEEKNDNGCETMRKDDSEIEVEQGARLGSTH